MLLALARDREVGVDVEVLRASVSVEAIARRYFHSDEYAFLMGCLEAERKLEFLRLWTRKEALLKAKGIGVSEIAVRPDKDPEFLVHALPLEGDYVAALAHRRPEASLVLYRWDSSKAKVKPPSS